LPKELLSYPPERILMVWVLSWWWIERLSNLKELLFNSHALRSLLFPFWVLLHEPTPSSVKRNKEIFRMELLREVRALIFDFIFALATEPRLSWTKSRTHSW
jgi:hypothetical protein